MEDIKILEEILKDKDWYKIHGGEDIGYPEVQAIENLLTRYKDLVETSIRLSKECVELEEENKRLNANLVYRKLQLTESIPISVIQNKLIEAEYYIDHVDVREGQAMYKVLQELLKENK